MVYEEDDLSQPFEGDPNPAEILILVLIVFVLCLGLGTCVFKRLQQTDTTQENHAQAQ